MLIEFKVQNFLSFENEQSFNMLAGKSRTFDDRVYKDKYNKILKFAAVFGANGSGKSNFVKAVEFSKDYIVFGNDRAFIPKYYKNNPSCKELPSLFEYKIKIGEKIYTYGFKVILSTNELVSEWLLCNYTRSVKTIFKYEKSNSKSEFLPGDYFKKDELKKLLKIYADGIDPNSSTLFLKTISKNENLFIEHEEASVLKDVFDWFATSLKVKRPDARMNDYAYFMSQENMQSILQFFKDFDLSISKYSFIACPKEQLAFKLPKELFNNLLARFEKILFTGENIEENRVMFGLEDDFYIARIIDEQVAFETLQFYHDGSNIPFHMYEEPDGTKKIFKLLEILFQEDEDVTYIVDEIDRCLHPLLTYNFIKAFLNKAQKSDCQLIVSTHESILLDFNLLRKDEIWFVSKDKGQSIFESPGSQIRSDVKPSKSYLLGKMGVPNIKNNAYKG